MRKIYAFLLLGLFCCLLCAGCSSSKGDSDIHYTLTETGKTDETIVMCSSQEVQYNSDKEEKGYIALSTIGFPDGGQYIDIPIDSFWNEENLITHIEDSVEKQKTISFEGKEYIGTYFGTKTDLGCNYSVHRYQDDSDFSVFEINSKTNELMRIEISHPQMLEGVVSETDAREIAYDFVSKYYNIEEYECELRRGTFDAIRNEYFDTYIFGFYRTVNDIWVRCGFVVEVGIDGQIYTYSHFMNEEIDAYINQLGIEEFEYTLERLIADETIEAVVSEAINGNDNYEVALLSKSFTLDENNNPTIILSINVTSNIKDNGQETISGEQLYIIVREHNN